MANSTEENRRRYYKTHPKIDYAVRNNDKISLSDLAVYSEGKPLTREGVKVYLVRSGQHAFWKNRKEELEKLEKEEPSKLISLLKLNMLRLAEEQGWAHEKALEVLNLYKEGRHPPSLRSLITFFNAYENSVLLNKKITLTKLGNIINRGPNTALRMLKKVGEGSMFSPGDVKKRSNQHSKTKETFLKG